MSYLTLPIDPISMADEGAKHIKIVTITLRLINFDLKSNPPVVYYINH